MAISNYEIRELEIGGNGLSTKNDKVEVNGHKVNEIKVGNKVVWANLSTLSEIKNEAAKYTDHGDTKVPTLGNASLLWTISRQVRQGRIYKRNNALYTFVYMGKKGVTTYYWIYARQAQHDE